MRRRNPDPRAILGRGRAPGRPQGRLPPPNGHSVSERRPLQRREANLGKTLFFDPRLSGPATLSCGTCHNPAFAWKDGLPTGVGFNGKHLARATPTVINAAWSDLLMWDGRFDTFEQQALGPITSATEMNLSERELVARVSALPGYRQAFAAVFPDQPISGANIAKAIATFERTLVSNKAPFDRWIEGDETAISDQAKRGFEVFNGKANCAACHSGWRFTDDGFHDIGLPGTDLGRANQVPDEPALQYAFKTPTLRNVALRAPYMHDGSVDTLHDVIRHYATGFVDRPSLSPDMKRFDLSDAETENLVAFLKTLTSSDDPITLPSLPASE